jgi:hypothetical protein
MTEWRKQHKTRIRHDGFAMSFKDQGSHFGIFRDQAIIREGISRWNRSLREWLIFYRMEHLLDRPLEQCREIIEESLDPVDQLMELTSNAPGIQCLYTTIGRSASLLSTDTLRLELNGAGKLLSCEETDEPYAILQQAQWDKSVHAQVSIYFAETDAICIDVEMTASTDIVHVTPEISGTVVAEKRAQEIEVLNPGCVRVSVNPSATVTNGALSDFITVHESSTLPLADLRAHWIIETDLRDATVSLSCGDQKTTEIGKIVRSVSGNLAYRITGTPISLLPGVPVSFRILISMDQEGLTQLKKQHSERFATYCAHPKSFTVERARQRWLNLRDGASHIPEDAEPYRCLYEHAMAVLVMNEYVGRGPYLQHHRASYCTRGAGLCVAHYWDSCFTAVALVEWDGEAAQQAIEVMLSNATSYGAPPEAVGRQTRTATGQAPIEAWAAWKVFEQTNDLEFLRSVYTRSSNYYHYWFEHRDFDRDGLCEWRNGGQIGDDSPRWDLGDQVRNNVDFWEYESPDLSGFLLSQAKHLAKMAEVLGLQEEGKLWRSRAESLDRALLGAFYHEEDLIFYDRLVLTHEPLKTIAPNHFIPLWAGVQLPDQLAKRMIERYLLSEQHLYGNPPFPSISYDHPKFDPFGYWRGRIWPHFTYWMIEVLWKYGFHKQADEAAERLLQMVERWPYFQENYSGFGRPAGIPEYNWTAAAVILLILRKYRNDS